MLGHNFSLQFKTCALEMNLAGEERERGLISLIFIKISQIFSTFMFLF